MGDLNLKPHTFKHKRSHDKDSDRKSYKRHKHNDYDSEDSSRERKRKNERDKPHIIDDDPDDEDMWVEKNIDIDGELVGTL